MRPSQYTQLCSIARRIVADVGEAEDIAQDAFLAAYLAGHTDFEAAETRQWLVGTVRNMARMAVCGTVRAKASGRTNNQIHSTGRYKRFRRYRAL